MKLLCLEAEAGQLEQAYGDVIRSLGHEASFMSDAEKGLTLVRTRAVDLTAARRRGLFTSISRVIGRAVKLHGRTDEYDLCGERGGYERVLNSKTAGEPCTRCGEAAIVKESFLGGAIYFCPKCQQPPPRPSRKSARRSKSAEE